MLTKMITAKGYFSSDRFPSLPTQCIQSRSLTSMFSCMYPPGMYPIGLLGQVEYDQWYK